MMFKRPPHPAPRHVARQQNIGVEDGPVRPPVIPKGFADPRRRAGQLTGTILAGAFLFLLLASAQSALSSLELGTTLLVGLGVLGVWRHGWGVMNFFRALRFIRRPTATGAAAVRMDLIAVVTAYNQSNTEVAAVMSALANSTRDLPNKTLVVFAYRDEHHRTIVEQLARQNPKMVIHYVIQTGLGKREALAASLSVARDIAPTLNFEKYALLLMDGDTVPTTEAITQSIQTLETRPDLGAVVVNEIPYIKGGDYFATWRLLRSFQRNKLMSAFALSDRTLVLTGRFAMVRAEILLQVGVISRIRKDFLQTKKLHIPLLTGDDKTTWLEVLRRGYGMTYLPHAYVYPIEVAPPDKGFLSGVVPLTARYSGNMARANLHADAWRGTKGKIHFAYGLLDQRVSMWTSLLTPLALIYLLAFEDFRLFIILLTYTVTIKHIQAMAISYLSGHYDPRFPYLMLFDQIVQSAVKIRAFAYLHQQAWNNQAISAKIGLDEEILNKSARRTLRLRVAFFGICAGYALVLAR